jgi:hypothetical protein
MIADKSECRGFDVRTQRLDDVIGERPFWRLMNETDGRGKTTRAERDGEAADCDGERQIEKQLTRLIGALPLINNSIDFLKS